MINMRKLGDDKRGQNLTLGTIILIVLGVAVLIFLIFGFSTGWTNLWGKITSFTGGAANVDTTRQACTLACNSESEYDYCDKIRTVRYDDKSWEKGSCKALEGSNKISLTACDNLCKDVVDPIESSEDSSD